MCVPYIFPHIEDSLRALSTFYSFRIYFIGCSSLNPFCLKSERRTFYHFTQQNLQTLQAPIFTRIAALNTLGSYCAFAPTLARQWGDGFLAIAEDVSASPELRATAISVWGRLGPQVYNKRRRI